MVSYFIAVGAEQRGPFSLDELRAQRIQPRTPVWHDQLPQWMYAEQLPELKDLLTKDSLAELTRPKLDQEISDLVGLPGVVGHLVDSVQTPSPPTILEAKHTISSEVAGTNPQLQYFISVLGKQRGPYSQTQLADQAIDGEIPIWRYGLAAWVRAKQLPELEMLLKRSRPQVVIDKPHHKGKRTAIVASFIISGLVVLEAWHLFHPKATLQQTSSGSNSSPALSAESQNPEGITREQLPLSSQLVTTQWSAWRSGSPGLFGTADTPDASSGCTGSSEVCGSNGNKLYLATNRHVLMINEIIQAKTTDQICMKTFDMRITFSTGKEKPVDRIMHLVYSWDDYLNSLEPDLAVLEVDASGLTEGVDFVTLPPIGDNAIEQGDDVVAVGNPEGLVGTQTYGHISAVRTGVCKDGTSLTWLQTDAAINHGNSGGPLFVARSGRYVWAGINTWGVMPGGGSEGLNFAIHSKHLFESKGNWYDASASGTAQALTEWYQFPVGAYTAPAQ